MKYTEHVLQDKESSLHQVYIDTELFKERSFISLLGDPVIFFGCQSPLGHKKGDDSLQSSIDSFEPSAKDLNFFHDFDFKMSFRSSDTVT